MIGGGLIAFARGCLRPASLFRCPIEDIPGTASTNSQFRAVASHHTVHQIAHRMNLGQLRIKFLFFLPGKFAPAMGRGNLRGKSIHEVAHLFQAKAARLRQPEDGNPVKSLFCVTSLPSRPLGFWQNFDLLPVSDRRCWHLTAP